MISVFMIKQKEKVQMEKRIKVLNLEDDFLFQES